MKRLILRILRVLLITVIIIVVIGVIAAAVLSQPRPKGNAGPDADRLAQEMLLAVNAEAWKETGAVRFTFMKHRHLWDRLRGFDRIEYGDRMVLLRIRDRSGRAWEDGSEADPARSADLVKEAHADWVNDTFWLNPVVKIEDQAARRSIVHAQNGVPQLLVEYTSGGLTPGDAYLWTPGPGGTPPTKWQMWVSNIPIGGLSVSWENWITLKTGARISTLHRMGPLTLRIEDVAGAKSLHELLGTSEDPFAPVVH